MDADTVFAWTDYPIRGLDISHRPAPIRRVRVLSYDGDKYCYVMWHGFLFDVKIGYLYTQPGRLGEVPSWVDDKVKCRTVKRRTLRLNSEPSWTEIQKAEKSAVRIGKPHDKYGKWS